MSDQLPRIAGFWCEVHFRAGMTSFEMSCQSAGIADFAREDDEAKMTRHLANKTKVSPRTLESHLLAPAAMCVSWLEWHVW